MASLSEAQAFLDQFDKCLPLCERGDAVTVINALHTLNNITQASIAQVKELNPSDGNDFFCSFLLELELALELFIAPNRKLGTIDGGLPALYSFSNEDLATLSEMPSAVTKAKVIRFLTALGVTPSPEFHTRGISNVVKDFLRCQVKKSDSTTFDSNSKGRIGAVAGVSAAAASGAVKSISISWADQCSSGESDLEDMPPLEDGDDDTPVVKSQPIAQSIPTSAAEDEVEAEESEEEEEEESYPPRDEAAYTFLFSQPVHRHGGDADDHDAPMGLCKPLPEEGYGMHGKIRTAPCPDQFYKTRMCKNWEQTGSCQYGSRCNFAHGDEDLRPSSATAPAWSSSSSSPARPATRRQQETSEEPDRTSPLYKTRMCINYEQTGQCKYGDKCNFAHGKDELRRGAAAGGGGGAGKAGLKKRLCERFAAGTCAYGAAKCVFAHGPEDLK